MRAEIAASPGQRGISPKTCDRIIQAEQLVLSGKAIDEIAQILNISRIAVVNWCSLKLRHAYPARPKRYSSDNAW
jgi:hypothetical protein